MLIKRHSTKTTPLIFICLVLLKTFIPLIRNQCSPKDTDITPQAECSICVRQQLCVVLHRIRMQNQI